MTIVYNYKEYNHIYINPTKKQQERVIVEKIMSLLNNNKYNNLEDFQSKNDNYQIFLKKNNMDIVVKHFGNNLSEDDYVNIINNLKSLTAKKNDFAKENIKETNIDDNQYVSFRGNNKNYYIDNSYDKISIQERMKIMQNDNIELYSSSNIEENTEKMFKDISKTGKENINFKYLNEINTSNLTDEEVEFFNIVLDFQKKKNELIRVDLSRKIIIDSNENIFTFNPNTGNFINDNQEENFDVNENTISNKQKALTLVHNDSIYSNAA